MSLEALIGNLITSLDKNTAAVLAAKGGGAAAATNGNVVDMKNGKAGTAKATAAKPPEKPLDFDTIKLAAAKVLEKHGKPFVKNLIKTVGESAELATVKPEKYKALMAAFEKAEAEEPEADEDEDEDSL